MFLFYVRRYDAGKIISAEKELERVYISPSVRLPLFVNQTHARVKRRTCGKVYYE